MGRYSRKDMLEFAKFAKSYQSPRNVNDAYADYLKGVRIVTNKTESVLHKILKSNVVFLDGKTIKDRHKKPEVNFMTLAVECVDNLMVERWNRKTKVLYLNIK